MIELVLLISCHSEHGAKIFINKKFITQTDQNHELIVVDVPEGEVQIELRGLMDPRPESLSLIANKNSHRFIRLEYRGGLFPFNWLRPLLIENKIRSINISI